MKTWIIIMGIMLLPPLTGSAEAQERRVTPGDSLVVTVTGHPELSGRFQVNSLGDLLIPSGGVIPAAGLIPSVIAQRISETYRPYFGNVRVSVTSPEPAEEPEGAAPPIETPPPATDTTEAVEPDLPPPDTVAVPDSVSIEEVMVEPDSVLPITTPDIVLTPPDTVLDPEPPPVRQVIPQERIVEEAQGPPTIREEAREVSIPSRSTWNFALAALGGVASTTSPSHGFGGILATAGWGRLGVMGLGQYGSGGGYSSLLLSGGITYEVFRAGPLSVLGTGGYSLYSENGDTGIERSVPAAMAGGIASVRIGPIRPAVAVTGFFGNYEGDDLTEAFSVSFVRVSFGIGF